MENQLQSRKREHEERRREFLIQELTKEMAKATREAIRRPAEVPMISMELMIAV